MSGILDHPDIRRAEATGYPEKEREYPICPVCGAGTDTFYKCDEEIVGCDECVTAVDAWEV